MHALGRIHHALRANGKLLDLHPQPENTLVEVWQEGRVEALGPLDEEEDIRDIRRARAHMSLVEQRGWFVTERQVIFEMLQHYPSVQDWMERRAREDATSTIPEVMIGSARHLLSTGGGELIKRELVRASLLRRLP